MTVAGRPAHRQLHLHAEWADLRLRRGQPAQSADNYLHEKLHDRAARADLAKLDSSLLFTLNLTPPVARQLSRGDNPYRYCYCRSDGAQRICRNRRIPVSPTSSPTKMCCIHLFKSGSAYVAVQKIIQHLRIAAGRRSAATGRLQHERDDLYGYGRNHRQGPRDGSSRDQPRLYVVGHFADHGRKSVRLSSMASPRSRSMSSGCGTGAFRFPATDPSGNATLLSIFSSYPGRYRQSGHRRRSHFLPGFTRTATFRLPASVRPLTFETGGYQRLHHRRGRTATPVESFSAAWNTPITLHRTTRLPASLRRGEISAVGFWHSIPATPVGNESVFTYSSNNALVSYATIEFPNTSLINVTVNETVMQAATTPSTINSGWRISRSAIPSPM